MKKEYEEKQKKKKEKEDEKNKNAEKDKEKDKEKEKGKDEKKTEEEKKDGESKADDKVRLPGMESDARPKPRSPADKFLGRRRYPNPVHGGRAPGLRAPQVGRFPAPAGPDTTLTR